MMVACLVDAGGGEVVGGQRDVPHDGGDGEFEVSEGTEVCWKDRKRKGKGGGQAKLNQPKGRERKGREGN